jgi:hypothetical protein
LAISGCFRCKVLPVNNLGQNRNITAASPAQRDKDPLPVIVGVIRKLQPTGKVCQDS